MKNIPIQHGKETWNQLEAIHHFGYSYATIFNDFVDTILVSLLSLSDNLEQPNFIEKLKANKLTGIYEDQYLQLVDKYKENKSKPQGERPIDYIAKAWGALQKETKELDEDILGEIYMTKVSFGEHGQFFTPMPVTNFMAQIVGATGKTVSDPCCGSGRMFLSMNKLNKDMFCIGVDLSSACAKMTALNMWLFDINADIYEGNSLTMKMSQLWRIRKGGFMYHELVKEMPEPQKRQMQQTIFDVEEYKKAA